MGEQVCFKLRPRAAGRTALKKSKQILAAGFIRGSALAFVIRNVLHLIEHDPGVLITDSAFREPFQCLNGPGAEVV